MASSLSVMDNENNNHSTANNGTDMEDIALIMEEDRNGSTLDGVSYNENSNKRHHYPNSTLRAVASSIINCLQRQQVSSSLVFFRNDRLSSPSSSSLPTRKKIPLITGLDRVFIHPATQPAAEAVTILGIHPPRYLCYMVSGAICDVIQFGLDLFLHLVLQLQDPSICWALGFGGSIIFRHSTHRYLVFGDYVGGYYASLGRMYTGYSIIILLSTVFNFIMTHYAKFPHYVAWIITLLWTGIVNYFILKKLWSFGGSGAMAKTKADSDTEA